MSLVTLMTVLHLRGDEVKMPNSAQSGNSVGRSSHNRIPKVINYCWFGGKPLPRLSQKCIASWKRACPDYEIKRWDETNFDVHQHPFVASAYEAGAWAFVSDWARLKILYDEGGIYLDTDIKLLRSLDDFLDNECYIGVQQPARLCTTGLGFGCVKSSIVVKKMLEQYDGQVFSWERAKELACPWLNDKVVREFGYAGDGCGDVVRLNNVTVYPCRYFDPISTGSSRNLMCLETASVSLYADSWGDAKKRFQRALVNGIGVDRVFKIKEWLGRV